MVTPRIMQSVGGISGPGGVSSKITGSCYKRMCRIGTAKIEALTEVFTL